MENIIEEINGEVLKQSGEDSLKRFYEQHIKKHNVTTCWICGEHFSGPPQVMSHAIGKHTEWRSTEYLECPICGEKIKR